MRGKRCYFHKMSLFGWIIGEIKRKSDNWDLTCFECVCVYVCTCEHACTYLPVYPQNF